MTVSFSRVDSQPCAACGRMVTAETWLILHRLERPQLWARCRHASIHTYRCSAGHKERIEAPLLLFDPGLPFVIWSPALSGSTEQEEGEREMLMLRLQQAVTPQERERCLKRVRVVPRELLGGVLGTPELNLHDFAPGAEPTEALANLYSSVLVGSPPSLWEIIETGKVPPAVAAALRYELAMYLNRRPNDIADYLEEAIRQFYLCLDFYDRAQYPARWAAIQSELALSYMFRQVGHRRDNLREALRCSDLALEVFSADSFPEDYAMTQANRAKALLDSNFGDPDAPDRGIEAYQAALAVFTRESYPESWASALADLATVYIERARPGDLEQAADALELAVSELSPQESPRMWATAQMNLGMVLRRLPEERSGPGRSKAITALRAAYNVFKDRTYEREHLAVLYNLGLTLARSNDPQSLAEAASLLEQTRSLLLGSDDHAVLEDCTEELADVFLSWLVSGALASQEYEAFGLRVLRAFEDEHDSERVGLLFHEVARHVISGEEIPEERRRDLARRAAERALEILRHRKQLEFRAKALAVLGLTYLPGQQENRQDNRERAMSCFEAAIKIYQRLDPTPERNAALGHLYVDLVGAGGTL